MSDQTIICPNCETAIPLSDALTQQIANQLKKELADGQRAKEAELAKKQAELVAREQVLAVSQNEAEQKVKELVFKQVEVEKAAMWAKAQQLAKDQAAEKNAAELKLMADAALEKDRELQKMRKAELELLKEKNKLEDEKKGMELEMARKLDTERQRIAEEASKRITEEYRFKDAEKEKKLQDAIKANEELRRKLEQGSQQMQGEVLEIELEELLKSVFPHDVIEPVPKGVNGADILQRVYNPAGQFCGTIAWESKRTKAWSDGWLSKLKEDQRMVKAEVAVLISEVLPKHIETFAQESGVWVTNYDCLQGLAAALRVQLMEVTKMKLAAVGKNEKMEVLYNYLSGLEFTHKVEAIVEAFVAMEQDLQEEKRQFARRWAKREKQIQSVINNTAGMYGDMQGLIGSSMQTIPALEPGLDRDN